jgi:predicted nuclease of predicted toxin-antitoxin system
MKLLFDHNISPRSIGRLADIFPDATHVALVGLERAADPVVWASAQLNDRVIATKDADFSDLSTLRGFPPKGTWLRTGNCTTGQIAALLRSHEATILAFATDDQVGTLVLLAA